ncbi:unnamed protein product [Amoebophrya sp. A25]|nr:unnamed protein product [Amoebophrya sp. A25]|eukprot:GSA25T00021349001.1
MMQVASRERICEAGSAEGWIFPLFEAEKDLPKGVLAAIYITFLAYLFLGIAVGSDVFMTSIEALTSMKRAVVVGGKTVHVDLWNETVATLTLMALGSSAPEILLATVELVQRDFYAGEMGVGTIVGSAAFNLFLIIAVCICTIPDGESRVIREFGVFKVCTLFMLCAYLWILVCLEVWTPGQITAIEGVITLLFFPLLVLVAYRTSLLDQDAEEKADAENTDPASVVPTRSEQDRRQLLKRVNAFAADDDAQILQKVVDWHLRNPHVSETNLLRLMEQEALKVTAQHVCPKDHQGGGTAGRVHARRLAKRSAALTYCVPSCCRRYRKITEQKAGRKITANAHFDDTFLADVAATRTSHKSSSAGGNGHGGAAESTAAGASNIGGSGSTTTTAGVTTSTTNQNHQQQEQEEHQCQSPASAGSAKGSPRGGSTMHLNSNRGDPQLAQASAPQGGGRSSIAGGLTAMMSMKTVGARKSHQTQSVSTTKISFMTGSYTVVENMEKVVLNLHRIGPLSHRVQMDYRTRDGTAISDKNAPPGTHPDYKHVEATLVFEPGQSEALIAIPIYDDDAAEEDETFLVELVLGTGQNDTDPDGVVVAGKIPMAEVLIIDDDGPGTLQVAEHEIHQTTYLHPTEVTVILERRCGITGRLRCRWRTVGASAVEGRDFEAVRDGVVTMEHGQCSAKVSVPILAQRHTCDTPLSFYVVFLDPEGFDYFLVRNMSTSSLSLSSLGLDQDKGARLDDRRTPGQAKRTAPPLGSSVGNGNGKLVEGQEEVAVAGGVGVTSSLGGGHLGARQQEEDDKNENHDETMNTATTKTNYTGRDEGEGPASSSTSSRPQPSTESNNPARQTLLTASFGDQRDLNSLMEVRVVLQPEKGVTAYIEGVYESLREINARINAHASGYREALVTACFPGDVEGWGLHLLMMPWKVYFAIFVPPPSLGHGAATFVMSLALMGFVVACVNDVALMIGCALEISDMLTALTLVAAGTSLPDTFASKIAAEQSEFADESITNVTGSNSVNVFLGLGLPWVLASIYWALEGPTAMWRGRCQHMGSSDLTNFCLTTDTATFIVPVQNVSAATMSFLSAALVAVALLIYLDIPNPSEDLLRWRTGGRPKYEENSRLPPLSTLAHSGCSCLTPVISMRLSSIR